MDNKNQTFYLTFKNDQEHIEIGEVSFTNFWADRGFKILTKIINDVPEAIDDVIIKNDKGEVIKITEFLDIIGKLKIII